MASGNDPFFIERLDIFMEKCLNDIREFALREQRSFEQVRELAFDWHWKHMFGSAGPFSLGPNSKVKEILEGTSKQLDSLLRVAGRHSLLLVINPEDEHDDGFLGGTNTGRDFWLGLRNGGAIGVRHFKQYCKDSLSSPTSTSKSPEGTANTVLEVSQAVSSSKTSPAVVLKNQLYVEMRNALRSACGIRNAEMKWSKQGKLSVYGVTLVGWPREVEYKNPSRMSSQEMTKILSLLRLGTLRFTSLREQPLDSSKAKVSQRVGSNAGPSESVINETKSNEADTDISWAYNDAEIDIDLVSSDNTGQG